MAYTLIVNPGSTSRKYSLYEGTVCRYSVLFEDTGNGIRMCAAAGGVCDHDVAVATDMYAATLQQALTHMIDHGILDTMTEIVRVGVRVVAPLPTAKAHAVLDETYIDALTAAVAYAPRHLPPLLDEIRACQQLLPQARLVGVSDSAFHATMPRFARTISVAAADARSGAIERYGYHGLSVASIVRRVPQFLSTLPPRMIVCHVGGGISLTAVQNGKSVATSMGYSPASGLMMGGRGGDIDADAFAAVAVQRHLSPAQYFEYLYDNCGFAGVAGVRDLRLLLERAAAGDPVADDAVAMLRFQLRSWIGSHVATLNGLDAIVLTGTAAVRNPHVRALALDALDALGIILDHDRNESIVGKEGIISARGSAVTALVMQTDEMGEMVQAVDAVLK